MVIFTSGCSDEKGKDGDSGNQGPDPGGSIEPPAASCDAAGDGQVTATAAPELIATLFDRWHEAWLGSPTVADIDGDGENEILVPRDGLMLGWHLDGTVVATDQPGRVTQGRGELVFREGIYRGYGQSLAIEPGRLVFAGPIDDPAVDVRAYRREK